MVTKEELGERIKKVMKERDVTQKMLADKIGITQSKISNYVNGKNFPPVDVLASMAEELHISLDCLVYGIPELKDGPSEQTYEFNTCGDVARMLFALSDKMTVRIVESKESYDIFDTSTGYPEKEERKVYLIRLVGEYEWNKAEWRLNGFLEELAAKKIAMEKAEESMRQLGVAQSMIDSVCQTLPSWMRDKARKLDAISLPCDERMRYGMKVELPDIDFDFPDKVLKHLAPDDSDDEELQP